MDELKQKYIGKYFAEDKIADITITDMTTPSGRAVFELTLEGGKKVVVPEKGLTSSVTDEKSDSTTMYTTRLAVISYECLDVMKEYDVPSYLFDRVTAKIKLDLDNHIERAAAIAWFGSDKEYAAGFSTQGMVTLMAAEKMVKGAKKEDGE